MRVFRIFSPSRFMAFTPRTSDSFDAVSLSVASPEDIIGWSRGEVTKPETVNYRTQRAEPDGLFCERIFGPTKNFQCFCGKYKGIRYNSVVCEKCGVEVTRSIVRRERMGHINLAVPVTHIWFLRSSPSRLGLLLDLSIKTLEQIVYFSAYIVVNVDEENKGAAIKELNRHMTELNIKHNIDREILHYKISPRSFAQIQPHLISLLDVYFNYKKNKGILKRLIKISNYIIEDAVKKA
jgi:DNA-directed RNA polymerase beta' subunit